MNADRRNMPSCGDAHRASCPAHDRSNVTTRFRADETGLDHLALLLPERDLTQLECRLIGARMQCRSMIAAVQAGGLGTTADARRRLAYEHGTLEALDRALRALMVGQRAVADTTPKEPGDRLDDALTVSVHAAINGAYADATLEYAHEMLTAAAWLGAVVSRGAQRVPSFLISSFGELLDCSERDHRPASRLLTTYAQVVLGEEQISRLGRAVTRGGPIPHAEASKSARSRLWQASSAAA